MKIDQAEDYWLQFKWRLKKQWAKLTDDDLKVIAGRRERLEGRISAAYGIGKEQAHEEVEEFLELWV